MLQLSGVSAGYQGKDVLFDISASFEPGVNYCLLGPNGCGKTTLLRAIARLIDYRGSISWNGTDLKKMSRREIAGHIAVMCQNSGSSFSYSVYDAVMLGRYARMKRTLFSGPGEKDREAVRNCLERTNLWELRKRPIDQLSGGQRQRVFLAQALAQDPDVILLDEPANHLDMRHQIDLVDSLHAWTADGSHSVIGVFHDIDLALRFSENMLFLKDGKLLAQGPFAQAANRQFLQNVVEMDVVGYMQASRRKWDEVS